METETKKRENQKGQAVQQQSVRKDENHLENLLDDALRESFPASDSPAISVPIEKWLKNNGAKEE